MGATANKTNPQPHQRLSNQQKAAVLAKTPYERFRSDGYSIMPRALFIHAHKFAPGGSQLLAVAYILYVQFDSKDTPEWVKVSPSALARLMTGPDLDGKSREAYTAKSFDVALSDAAARGLIEREKRGRDWWYRAFPEDWGAALDYKPLGPVEVPRKKIEPDSAPRAGEEQIVASGKLSVPSNVAMKVNVEGLPAPVEFDVKFRLRNEAGILLSSRSCIEDGVLTCTVAAAQKAFKTGNSHTRTLPEIPKPTEQDQRLSGFRAAISAALENRWQKPLDEALLTRVVAAAGPEIPVADFVARFEADAASLARKRKPVESGLLIWSAEQARKQWESQSATRAKREEHNAQLRAAAAPPSFDASGDETVWPQVRAAIRKQVTAESYANWFARTRGEGVSEEGTLLVAVVDAPTAEYLAEEHEIVLARLAHALDPRVERVQFFVEAKAGGAA